MAQFSVNANRFDPYKNFKFRVKWDGKYVAGVSKVGGLKADYGKSSLTVKAVIQAVVANHQAEPSTKRSRLNVV